MGLFVIIPDEPEKCYAQLKPDDISILNGIDDKWVVVGRVNLFKNKEDASHVITQAGGIYPEPIYMMQISIIYEALPPRGDIILDIYTKYKQYINFTTEDDI